jgi:cephalosporin-C deacetylase
VKKIVRFISLIIVSTTSLFAQNFLSPVWKISCTDTTEANISKITPANWEEVNLLLSWERQNYSWINGNGCLTNEFTIPDLLHNSEFVLSVGLQCDVKSIYVNGKYIGGKLPNQFWSKRGAKTDFIIPDDCLIIGGKNRIAIFVSNFSYTGGISCNICSITPKESKSDSEIKIVIPVKDHLYSINESNSFQIKYISDKKGKIKLSIANDFHQSIVQKEFKINEGNWNINFDFNGEINKPGFYECIVIMNDGGYSSDVKWFALSPEKIKCSNNTVKKFKEFWDSSVSDLNKINPDFTLKKVENLCNEFRDGFICEMKSLGGLTIRGYYFVPKTSGKHAAILHVPGYGQGYEDRRVFLENRENVVELALCIRGHGISADVFNPGFSIPGIWGYKLYSETENAYRGIYMDCVRAVQFLLSRPEVDSARIGVIGGSQGGGLTLVTAGLCKDNIKACSFFDPFPCDTRHQLKIRTMCNTEIKNYTKFYNNKCTFEEALNIQDLIDTKGFAEFIKCPTFFVTSLFDDDAPSHMGFSAYNRIKAPKSFKVFPELGHLNDKAHNVQMQFLKKELGF